MSTLIKKHLIRPYLDGSTNGTPSWVQIKKATEFSRSMNGTTEDRDYIADEMPTTELTQYKPSESLAITSYSGEPDFELFYDLYKKRAIGTAAQKKFLLVYMFDEVEVEGETETCYYAEQSTATVVVNELNASGSTISVDVHENGTPVVGYVKYDSDGVPTFTANA